MLAMLVCRDAECRAAFEASGSPEAIAELRCGDCGGPLKAIGWADGDGGRAAAPADVPSVRRAA